MQNWGKCDNYKSSGMDERIVGGECGGQGNESEKHPPNFLTLKILGSKVRSSCGVQSNAGLHKIEGKQKQK